MTEPAAISTLNHALFFLCLGMLVSASSLLAADQKALLQLVINDVEKGEVLVLLRDGDLLARLSVLEMAGLTIPPGRRENIESDLYISLPSLASALTFQMDEGALALRLSVDPALLTSTKLDFSQARPRRMTYDRATTAFINYALNYVSDWSTTHRFTVFSEAGFNLDGALLYNTLSLDSEGTVIRGLTNLTLDNRQSLTRWVIGDSFVNSGSLGGSLFLGGISASREFGLDPYFVRYPTVGLSGAVLTPSTVDVYVNGVLLRREQLPPGQFEFRNLPIPAGSATTRLVVRDAFGREREVASSAYLTTGLLEPGLHEYSYNLGSHRINLSNRSWDYESVAFLGRHRVGLTRTLTSGLRLEAAPGLISGGPTLTYALPFGETELSAAASRDKGFLGWAVALSYLYRSMDFSFGFLIRSLTRHYATLALDAREDRPGLETNTFVGIPLGSRTSLSLRYTFKSSYAKSQDQGVFLSATTRLTDRIALVAVGSHSREGGKSVNEMGLSLHYFFGNTTASLSHGQRNHVGSTVAELQRSLPVGEGFGFRLQGGLTDNRELARGLLQYQGSYGRYEVEQDRAERRNITTLNAAGGLVAINRSIFATRPVEESFAVIQVPGLAGVRGYVAHQEVGRTNARGDLFVPNLLPYYGNPLAISDRDIPLDSNIEATEKIVAPPFRGGAVVTFPVKRIQRITGGLLVEASGRATIPAYGELIVMVDGERFESPIGNRGQFYFENVPAGRHQALIEYGEGNCEFSLVVPASDKGMIELGNITCFNR